MIRLVLLTLAALFVILTVYGTPDPNAPAIGRQVTATVPTPEPQPQPAPAPAEPEAKIVKAVSQTTEQAPRFPGPALRPSPEHESTGDAALAELAPAADARIMFVTGSRVNFRAGPSTGNRVIGALMAGSPVEIVGPDAGGWANIRDAEGRTGYMSAKFLSANAPN